MPSTTFPSCRQRVPPFQLRKTRDIRIGYQIPCRLALLQKSSEDRPVLLRRIHHADHRASEPLVHTFSGFSQTQWTRESTRTGADADERTEDNPRQANR